jgi:tripartite-type tricarboxylate transporter receptor subunit TctC
MCLLSRLAAAGLACAAFAVHAQPADNYPVRPVRMLIPFSPGGATDVPGRIVAQKLSERLGQQVVVDNRPGAGGIVATEVVATAQPDGYTILMTATPFAISPAIYKKLPYHPLRDFAPVMQFGSAPNTLVVHPALAAKSVQELLQLARAQPGKIDWASSGTGGAQHLFGALFTSMAKIDMTHVPYKGSGPATTDLLGGQVKVGFPGIAIALPHHKGARLRILAVTSAKRSPQAPDVPSLHEAGVPGYDATLWLGIAAPRGTPPAIIARLNAEVSKALQAPEVRQQFASTGTDAVTSTPEEFGAFVKNEIEKWARVVREAGVTAN